VNRLRTIALFGVAALIALFFSAPAHAHAVGISKGDYVATGSDVVADLTFARPELARSIDGLDSDGDGTIDDAELARGRDVLAAAFTNGVRVRNDGAPCPATFDSAEITDQDGVHLRLRFRCAEPVAKLVIQLTLLDSLAHGHRHIASAEIGAAANEDILYRGHDEIVVTAVNGGDSGGQSSPPPRPQLGALAFVRMGIEHILTGYDHLVFLFGLLIVGGRVRALLGVVTAFTVAHSITLALAALNIWTPPSRVVEAGIALSIAYVGVENFFVTNAERRWRITFPFGLVHGFGFASALREVSLSRAQIPVALVSFNVGVELGQLSVMAVLLPVIIVCKRRGWLDRRVTLLLSAGVVAAGLAWFVQRALF
jgi:hypothetical protein